MMPIHEVFSRIRWDPEFGAAKIEIAYHDRTSNSEVRVPFERVRADPESHFSFEVIDEDGAAHMVPFHRVRRVWRDNLLIWNRARNQHRRPAE